MWSTDPDGLPPKRPRPEIGEAVNGQGRAPVPGRWCTPASRDRAPGALRFALPHP
jgi:hypothetical protein